MSDVVIGALIGVAAAVVGAIVQGVINNRLQVATEDRRETRLRRQSLMESRLRALEQAHRQLVTSAEYARASAVGEDPQQIAHLRTQTESSNYLEADATLFNDPDLLNAYLLRTHWWLSQPKGVAVRPTDLSEDADLGNRVQAAYRRARERIISDAESEAVPARA